MSLFERGRLLMTAGVRERVPFDEVVSAVGRHSIGDWGVISEADKAANEEALREGSRLLSAYETSAGKVWVLTEADRSSTLCLFPWEY